VLDIFCEEKEEEKDFGRKKTSMGAIQHKPSEKLWNNDVMMT